MFWAGMFVPPLVCSVPFRVGQILFCNVYFDGVVVFLARIQLYYLHIDSNNIYLRVRSIVGIFTTYTSAMHRISRCFPYTIRRGSNVNRQSLVEWWWEVLGCVALCDREDWGCDGYDDNVSGESN